MAISDFFKRKQGGSGSSGASAGDASGVGAKSGDYIPKSVEKVSKLGGEPSVTLEGRLPTNTTSPSYSSGSSKPFPNYGPPVGDSYKGSVFSNSKDLVPKGKQLVPAGNLVSKSRIPGVKKMIGSMFNEGFGESFAKLGLPMEAARQLMTDEGVVQRTNSAIDSARLKLSPEARVMPTFFGANTANENLEKRIELDPLFKTQLEAQSSKIPASTYLNKNIIVERAPEVFKEPVVSAEEEKSPFDINPKGYAISSGKGGNNAYSQEADGSISKLDLNTGNRKILSGGISTIGLNGSTVSRELRPEERVALARSAKMIDDWNKYKMEKAVLSGFNHLPPVAKSLAYAKYYKNKNAQEIDREKIDADKEIARDRLGEDLKQLATTQRHYAAQEQNDASTFNLNLFKAKNEASGRREQQKEAILKLVDEGRKNLRNNQELASLLKTGNMWNPTSVKMVYTLESLKYPETFEELRTNMVNDKSIDPADYPMIEAAYSENL